MPSVIEIFYLRSLNSWSSVNYVAIFGCFIVIWKQLQTAFPGQLKLGWLTETGRKIQCQKSKALNLGIKNCWQFLSLPRYVSTQGNICTQSILYKSFIFLFKRFQSHNINKYILRDLMFMSLTKTTTVLFCSNRKLYPLYESLSSCSECTHCIHSP